MGVSMAVVVGLPLKKKVPSCPCLKMKNKVVGWKKGAKGRQGLPNNCNWGSGNVCSCLVPGR